MKILYLGFIKELPASFYAEHMLWKRWYKNHSRDYFSPQKNVCTVKFEHRFLTKMWPYLLNLLQFLSM